MLLAAWLSCTAGPLLQTLELTCVFLCCICVQALTLAPLFVWFELLFLLGYRPQLYAQLQQRVNADIAKYKQKGA